LLKRAHPRFEFSDNGRLYEKVGGARFNSADTTDPTFESERNEGVWGFVEEPFGE
jgi:hypothetical protein